MNAQCILEATALVVSVMLIAWGMTGLLRWLVDVSTESERTSTELRALKMDLANWAGAGEFSDGREYRIVKELAMKYARERSW